MSWFIYLECNYCDANQISQRRFKEKITFATYIKFYRLKDNNGFIPLQEIRKCFYYEDIKYIPFKAWIE